MLLILLCTAVLLALSFVLGRSLLVLLGRDDWTYLEGATGLALLMCVCGVAVRLPGHGLTALVLVGALTAVLALLARRRASLRVPGETLLVSALVVAWTCIPYVANARAGLLGVSFNNDLSVHLVAAQHFVDPSSVNNPLTAGYPVGPHSIVAMLGSTGIDLIWIWDALLAAVPALLAAAALQTLRDLRPLRRWLVAFFTAVVYLAAAYYAQGAFKETLQGLWVVVFALALRDALGPLHTRAGDLRAPRAGWRALLPTAVVLGLVAAASVYTYSYLGLAWLVGTFGVLVAGEALLALITGGLPGVRRLVLDGAIVGGLIIAVALIGLAPELGRVVRLFESIGGSASSSGAISITNLGNLGGPISAYEMFGVWPLEDFRLTAPDLFRAGLGGALGAIVAGYGFIWTIWRRDLALPSAAIVAVGIYWRIHATESPYVTAKALVIASPILILLAGRALLAERPRPWTADTPALLVLAAVFFGLVATSSYYALRGSFVGARDTASEMDTLRTRLKGEPTLFLGYTDFVVYELRDVPVQEPVVTITPDVIIDPRKKWSFGEEWDFDSIKPEWLDKQRYVVVPRSTYQSAPPPNFKPDGGTERFAIYRRVGPTPRDKLLLPESGAPGAVLNCRRRFERSISRQDGTARIFDVTPRVVPDLPAMRPGERTKVVLDVPKGRWDLSFQYVSPSPIRITAPDGTTFVAPANTDRPGPFWRLGAVQGDGSPILLDVHVENPSLLTSTNRVAYPQALAATQGAQRDVPLREACGRYVDHYTYARPAAAADGAP
jgi:hypothetical protein